jgi:hypothetical protein
VESRSTGKSKDMFIAVAEETGYGTDVCGQGETLEEAYKMLEYNLEMIGSDSVDIVMCDFYRATPIKVKHKTIITIEEVK